MRNQAVQITNILINMKEEFNPSAVFTVSKAKEMSKMMILQGDVHNIQAEEAKLFFIRKPMDPERMLKDYIGCNEKSRVNIQLRTVKEGPPRRFIKHDAAAEKANLADLYRRQQEEQEMLEDAEVTDHFHSQWADPTALKRYCGQGIVPSIVQTRWR